MSQKNKICISFLLIMSVFILQPLITHNLMANSYDTHISSSCTIFTVSIGDKVYFGNNEDYRLNNVYRWYIPAQNVSTTYFGVKEIYGAVFFGFDNNDNPDIDGWEQGGMNEYGLCYDANGLDPDIELNLNQSGVYPYTDHALAQILWDCKNVEEVITWFQNIKWYGSLGAQFHFADNIGDAVVVGVNATGQWVFTRIDSAFLVSTNFNLNDTSHGYYPCSRYSTATQMRGEITAEEDLNVSKCAEILYAVHQEGLYGTKYSNICDPVNLEFYFNSGDEFSVSEKFDLINILADIESFEHKNSFFGVDGLGEGILVKTEKIDIQFGSNTNTTSETNGMTILTSILGITLSMLLFLRYRKKQKKDV